VPCATTQAMLDGHCVASVQMIAQPTGVEDPCIVSAQTSWPPAGPV